MSPLYYYLKSIKRLEIVRHGVIETLEAKPGTALMAKSGRPPCGLAAGSGEPVAVRSL
jgi:hypothetical protein